MRRFFGAASWHGCRMAGPEAASRLTMIRAFRLFTALLATLALTAQPAFAKSRIKDIVEFEGVRENMLVGYGIVVGLNGTGDALRNAPFTKQTLESILERLGVNGRAANLNNKNLA